MTVTLAFLAGLFLGLSVSPRRRQKPLPPPPKPTIHMRGNTPAWASKQMCEYESCGTFYRNRAAYIDQDGRYWCTNHLPKDTRVAERMAGDPTEDGRCVIHDYKCPKPWEPY